MIKWILFYALLIAGCASNSISNDDHSRKSLTSVESDACGKLLIINVYKNYFLEYADFDYEKIMNEKKIVFPHKTSFFTLRKYEKGTPNCSDIKTGEDISSPVGFEFTNLRLVYQGQNYEYKVVFSVSIDTIVFENKKVTNLSSIDVVYSNGG